MLWKLGARSRRARLPRTCGGGVLCPSVLSALPAGPLPRFSRPCEPAASGFARAVMTSRMGADQAPSTRPPRGVSLDRGAGRRVGAGPFGPPTPVISAVRKDVSTTATVNAPTAPARVTDHTSPASRPSDRLPVSDAAPVPAPARCVVRGRSAPTAHARATSNRPRRLREHSRPSTPQTRAGEDEAHQRQRRAAPVPAKGPLHAPQARPAPREGRDRARAHDRRPTGLDRLKRPHSRWSEGQTAGENAVLHPSIVGSGVGSPGSIDRKPLFFRILQTSPLQR